ncbi:phage holin family protein [Lentibacter sp. XHP0401]|uniref:phage holin family protein n=1 Tax=Lentibacter sp. XHP0401 TaxID=2984334 RepID=UPI0039913C32
MFGIERKVAHTVKRAGLLTGGLLLCSVGAGFLTVAGWLILLPLVGTATTALIVACVYLGFGLIMLAIGSTRRRDNLKPPAEEKAPSTDGPPIMQAFLFGLHAGAQADRGKT